MGKAAVCTSIGVGEGEAGGTCLPTCKLSGHIWNISGQIFRLGQT